MAENFFTNTDKQYKEASCANKIIKLLPKIDERYGSEFQVVSEDGKTFIQNEDGNNIFRVVMEKDKNGNSTGDFDIYFSYSQSMYPVMKTDGTFCVYVPPATSVKNYEALGNMFKAVRTYQKNHKKDIKWPWGEDACIWKYDPEDKDFMGQFANATKEITEEEYFSHTLIPETVDEPYPDMRFDVLDQQGNALDEKDYDPDDQILALYGKKALEKLKEDPIWEKMPGMKEWFDTHNPDGSDNPNGCEMAFSLNPQTYKELIKDIQEGDITPKAAVRQMVDIFKKDMYDFADANNIDISENDVSVSKDQEGTVCALPLEIYYGEKYSLENDLYIQIDPKDDNYFIIGRENGNTFTPLFRGSYDEYHYHPKMEVSAEGEFRTHSRSMYGRSNLIISNGKATINDMELKSAVTTDDVPAPKPEIQGQKTEQQTGQSRTDTIKNGTYTLPEVNYYGGHAEQIKGSDLYILVDQPSDNGQTHFIIGEKIDGNKLRPLFRGSYDECGYHPGKAGVKSFFQPKSSQLSISNGEAKVNGVDLQVVSTDETIWLMHGYTEHKEDSNNRTVLPPVREEVEPPQGRKIKRNSRRSSER